MMNRSTVWAATVIVGAIPTNALITVGKAGMSSSVSRFNLNGIDVTVAGLPCGRHDADGGVSRGRRRPAVCRNLHEGQGGLLAAPRVPCARHGIGHASRAQRLRFRGHFPIDI